jgi:hypothetical protein
MTGLDHWAAEDWQTLMVLIFAEIMGSASCAVLGGVGDVRVEGIEADDEAGVVREVVISVD